MRIFNIREVRLRDVVRETHFKNDGIIFVKPLLYKIVHILYTYEKKKNIYFELNSNNFILLKGYIINIKIEN